MTIAETKAELAAAVNTVAGLDCYTERPTLLNPGTAFVRWAGWARDETSNAFTARYSVIVVLPQENEAAADAEAYRLADLLGDALQPVLFVDEFVPSLLAAQGSARGGLFTLTITGRTE